MFAAIYLLSHGVIKVVLVASLFRELLWAYPAAIVVFTLFIVYQLYPYALIGQRDHQIPGAFLDQTNSGIEGSNVVKRRHIPRGIDTAADDGRLHVYATAWMVVHP